MSFFDMFLSEEKKIAKNRRRLTSRDSQPEEREAAAKWLANHGTPKSILALLSRFDMKLEHQLNDKAERDALFPLVASLGDDAIKPLRSYLKQCRSVGVPLRLMEQMTDERQTIELVYTLLQNELDRDDFKPEKKHALLIWLAERTDEGAVAAAEPFLNDFDENVRCTAAEVLIRQGVDVSEALSTRLLHPDEDSNRLKHRVAEVFVANGWTVSDPEAMQDVLPDGYAVQNDRVVKR